MFRLVPILLLSGCQFGLTSNRGGRMGPPVAYNGCLAPEGRRAAGTWEDPVAVPSLPFVDVGDTTDAASSDVATWDCEPRRDRGGAEFVYRLTLPAPADLRVELTTEAGVGLMTQLVPVASVPVDGEVVGCMDAGEGLLEADLVPAGEYLLVVDTLLTPQGEAMAGAYTLTLDVVTRGEWREVQVEDGLTWKRWRSLRAEDLTSELFNVFVVDLASRDVAPTPHEGCQDVATVGVAEGARAGVSGGFADGACESLDMVRAGGETFSTNIYAPQQRAIGWDAGGPPELTWTERGADWTDVENAFGSYPSLVDGGLVTLAPAGTDELYTTRQARVAAGVSADDELLFLVADGGSTDVPGLTMDELAAAMIELGAIEAVNLAGAEAATAWVDGCSATGVVNWPVGGGVTTHTGAGTSADGIYVF